MKIVNLLAHSSKLEPPGMTFTQLRIAAERLGIAKATLARYLKRFVATGIALHDERHYRINALAIYGVKASDEFEIEDHLDFSPNGDDELARGSPDSRFAKTFSSMLEGRQSIWQDTPAFKRGDMSVQGLVNGAMWYFMDLYLMLLKDTLEARNWVMVRELGDRALNLSVSRALAIFLRMAWDLRGSLSVSELEGFEIHYTIHHKGRRGVRRSLPRAS